MTRDEILAMFARRLDSLNRLDTAALAKDCAEDCVAESPFAAGTAVGRAAVEGVNTAFFQAFRDLTFRQEVLIVDGYDVASLLSASGTHTGVFLGMAPTRRPVNFRLAMFYQLRDGLIVRERRIYDFTGLLVQVGVLRVKPSY
jgi:predicted ester cyclase